MLCLGHGAHIYVEKPFTLTSADAERVLEAARVAGRLVCAGHQLLFEGPALALDKARHLIGSVVHVESYFSFRTVRKSRDGRSLMSPVEQLLDILPHPVYTMLAALQSDHGAPPELVSVDVAPEGEVRAVVRAGTVPAVLTVSLRARPIDSFLRVVGTNGSLKADFVRGCLVALPGEGTSAVAIITNPYREAWQVAAGSTRGFATRILHKKKGYPGVSELAAAFYESILRGGVSPFSPASIRETVRVCEAIATKLRASEVDHERRAEIALTEAERAMAPAEASRGAVLVTGGNGLLGTSVVSELRRRGWPVRSVSRQVPPPSRRVPGVEYVAADLSAPLAPSAFTGVGTVVHCAAETAGGKEAHERNTIDATRNLLEASAGAGVKRFLHVSSIAVLKPGREVGGLVNEQTPVDAGNLARGPYVWAKAEAERSVSEKASALGIGVRIVRPGPLVDFDDYHPPGRLGRELGPVYLAIGPKSGELSLCAVRTAAEVIRAAVEDFDGMPPVLNLVEPKAPTRKDLLSLHLQRRPDLGSVWMPGWVLGALSPVATLAQRLLRPKAAPISIAAAFASERYDTTLAAQVIERARQRGAAGREV